MIFLILKNKNLSVKKDYVKHIKFISSKLRRETILQ